MELGYEFLFWRSSMNPNNPKTRLFLFLPSPWYYSLRWLILIGLGLAIYAQTFGFGFVFDDFDFIVNNPFIKKFSYVYHVWKTFPKTRTIGFYTFAFN